MKRQKAILVDLDGTLVNVSSIRHFVEEGHKDFDAFHRASMDCPPNFQVIDRIKHFSAKGFATVIVSGREAKFRRLTEFWIAMWDVPCDDLIMRATGNCKSDVDVKRNMFHVLKNKFEIVEAIDDRQNLLDMWQELKISRVINVENLLNQDVQLV
jgi:hypothetical protein